MCHLAKLQIFYKHDNSFVFINFAYFIQNNPFLFSNATHLTGTTNRSKFKTPSAHPRSKHPYSKANSTLKFQVASMPGGEEGIEMKDFSTSLRRRESGRKITTDCSSNENESSTGNNLRMQGSETGVPILELDAKSPVTKNSTQVSSENPHHLQEHLLYGSPALELNSQSPITKNSTQILSNLHMLSDDCGDAENRTLATHKASPITVRSPLRRSARIAKRRSVGQCAQAAGYPSSPLLKDGSFPVPSLLSPVSYPTLPSYYSRTSNSGLYLPY